MSETRSLLLTSAERLLDRHADTGTAEQFATAVAESGLYLTLTPEASGGMGAALSDAAALARLWGARAAPLPIVELLLAGAYAPPDEDLQSLAGGLAGLSPGPVDAAGWPGATRILLLRGGASPAAALFPAEGVEPWEDLPGMSRLRLAEEAADSADWMPLENATLPPDIAAPLLCAAAMTGVMEHIVEITLDYAQIRKQFGRTLSKFQAVQSLLSLAAGELAVTRAALDMALAKADAGRARAMDAAAVKAQAGRAAEVIAANAHQIFGAIGFSQEHELHRYTKRLWQWRELCGAQQEMEALIGHQAGAAGVEGLWNLIVD